MRINKKNWGHGRFTCDRFASAAGTLVAQQ
jgi:hypothetical protein